jgi:hypothetical protein
MKMCLIAIATSALAAGCSSLLGFKDPTFQEDRPIDATPIDGPIDGSIDTGPAACMASDCPVFGCDTATNMCRDSKLWIFPTAGAFLGNAFGGTDTPPNVRGGADGKCLATYTTSFSTRQCNPARVHAILYVSAADGLVTMASKYSIPTSVTVHRADDDAIVAQTWTDLLDISKTSLAQITTLAMPDGIVWTGANTTNTCANWTSALTADTGTRGYTSDLLASWFQRDTFRCDRTARLMCVCWSGGE